MGQHHSLSTETRLTERQMYAETIAGLSSITAIVYMLPFVKSRVLFAWDTLLL